MASLQEWDQEDGLGKSFRSLKRKVAMRRFLAEGWLYSANVGKTKDVD